MGALSRALQPYYPLAAESPDKRVDYRMKVLLLMALCLLAGSAWAHRDRILSIGSDGTLTSWTAGYSWAGAQGSRYRAANAGRSYNRQTSVRTGRSWRSLGKPSALG